jgi:hypothetical protein
MADTKATTVQQYLDELPAEKKEVIAAVRQFICKHLPDGYEETIGFGGITYSIPLQQYPNTYNKQPLCYLALAAQKNYCSLYLMSAYGYEPHEKALKDGFRAAGKKLDMGKSCLRFRAVDDLALEVIAPLIASIPPDKWIQIYEDSRKKI